MRAKTLALPAPASRIAWAAAALAGAGALYLQAMSPAALAVLRFGAICTGHPAGALHCAACYVAAAIAAGATGWLVSGLRVTQTRRGR